MDKLDLDLDNLNSGQLMDNKHDIHIRVAKRGNRSYLTTVENITGLGLNDLEKEKLATTLKKMLKCGGSYVKADDLLKLSGDHRADIKKFLVEKKLCTDEQIKLHGF